MNLKELSHHLNLSPTTVSRALNGYPEVSERTRERVEAAAKAMNYSPNARARGLAIGRAMALGFVIPMSRREEIMNPIFGEFQAGLGEVCAQAGYDVMLTLVDDAQQEQAFRRIQARGSVDGIIVTCPNMTDPRIALLGSLGVPFIVHGRASQEDGAYSWLDTNNTRAFARATEFLVDLGHRRIALLNGLERMDFAYRRRLGYESVIAARGLTPDPSLMRSEEMTEVYGYVSTRDMLRTHAPPTAFLVSSFISAIGVRRAIHEAGLVMGRDVSVITHDDDLSALKNGHDVPIFTATRSSVRLAGRRAAEMLTELIADPACAPRTELLESELIIGSSTGPAPT